MFFHTKVKAIYLGTLYKEKNIDVKQKFSQIADNIFL